MKNTISYDIMYTNNKGVCTTKIGLSSSEVKAYMNKYKDTIIINSFKTSNNDYNSIAIKDTY